MNHHCLYTHPRLGSVPTSPTDKNGRNEWLVQSARHQLECPVCCAATGKRISGARMLHTAQIPANRISMTVSRPTCVQSSCFWRTVRHFAEVKLDSLYVFIVSYNVGTLFTASDKERSKHDERQKSSCRRGTSFWSRQGVAGLPNPSVIGYTQ